MKKKAIIYIHGKGGSAAEAEHYAPLFPDYDVLGFDYKAQTPWEAAEEFSTYFDAVSDKYASVSVIANSIGAYFALYSLHDRPIEKALLISPVVDMEKLISDMMVWAHVSEAELRSRGEIPTEFGETLSWEYLCCVRAHPVVWNTDTEILYGEADQLTAIETVRAFAEKTGAGLTVMQNGEHWFHTAEQMAFLDRWAAEKL